MALIALASASGAPGVTTTATGLAIFWPAPCLLVEADLSGGSMIPGWYRGSLPLEKTLTQVAFTKTRNPNEPLRVTENSVPLGDVPGHEEASASVLPGFASAAQVGAMAPHWSELAGQLGDLEASGTDALIDLGRLRLPRDERESLLRQVDLLLLVTTTDLPMAMATIDVAQNLRRVLGESGLSPLGLLTIGPARRMRTRTLVERAGIPHLARIPHDPVRAEPLTYGFETKPRNYEKTAYATALADAAKDLRTRATQRRQRLTRPTL